MVKLSEDMVVARSKGSDLCNIKKLNCWGSELNDVSVIRLLPNVEVLSLSVNQISTLEDFQYCPNLQEIYIRKNKVANINEVLHLKNIPKLKSLWLADNPCADFEQYRMTVLRTLPHLQKLDNVPVENEEVQQAMIHGLLLPLPDSNLRPEEISKITSPTTNNSFNQDSRYASGVTNSSETISNRQLPFNCHSTRETMPKTSTHQSPEENFELIDTEYEEDEDRSNAKLLSPINRKTEDNYLCEEKKSPNQCYVPSPPSPPYRPTVSSDCDTRSYSRTSSDYGGFNNNISYREETSSNIRASREQYRDKMWASNSENYHQDCDYRTPRESLCKSQDSFASQSLNGCRSPSGEKCTYRQRPTYMGEMLHHHYENSYRKVNKDVETVSRLPNSDSPSRPFPLRPKTRNGNVLSAVLCLIKELDYSGLEVAEMAVRCRMEEIED